MKTFIKCSKRLPSKNGEYRIKHNSFANNGNGILYFDIKTGWDIHDAIKSFYEVIGWYEE